MKTPGASLRAPAQHVSSLMLATVAPHLTDPTERGLLLAAAALIENAPDVVVRAGRVLVSKEFAAFVEAYLREPAVDLGAMGDAVLTAAKKGCDAAPRDCTPPSRVEGPVMIDEAPSAWVRTVACEERGEHIDAYEVCVPGATDLLARHLSWAPGMRLRATFTVKAMGHTVRMETILPAPAARAASPEYLGQPVELFSAHLEDGRIHFEVAQQVKPPASEAKSRAKANAVPAKSRSAARRAKGGA
jgi:hypothetical protein